MNFEPVKQALEQRGYTVSCHASAADAAAYLDRAIDGKTVGIGGSVTVSQMGLLPRLSAHNTVWWHNDPAQVEQYGAMTVRRHAMDTDVYLSSVNALAESGEIVNIDGTGNRIASMSFGHGTLYLVVGRNKLAPDLAGALWRARNVASPKNAQRLHVDTPCAVRGDRCYDCQSPARICRGVLILERPLMGTHTEVLLVDEELGY